MYESFLRAPVREVQSIVHRRFRARLRRGRRRLGRFYRPRRRIRRRRRERADPLDASPPGSVVPIDAIGVAVAPTRVHADVDATEHVGENPRDIAPRETSSALARASVHPLRALEKANRPMMSRAHAPSPTETTLDRVRRRSRGARIRGFRAHYFTPSRRASPRGGVTRDTTTREGRRPPHHRRHPGKDKFIRGVERRIHLLVPVRVVERRRHDEGRRTIPCMHWTPSRGRPRRDDVTRHDNTHRHGATQALGINVCMGMRPRAT